MFDITKLALKIPNFLTNKECSSLIDEFEQRNNESFKESSKNYHTDNVEQSSFDVVSLKPYTKNFNLIKEKTKKAIEIYINYLNQPNFFFTDSLKESLRFSHSYRIMKYTTGSNIHAHSDHDLGIYGSISFNLNDNYEGGNFKFFNQNHTISLNKGDVLIFPADYFWVHEVTSITSGSRYSVSSFIGSYPLDVLQNIRGLSRALSNDYYQYIDSDELLGPYN